MYSGTINIIISLNLLSHNVEKTEVEQITTFYSTYSSVGVRKMILEQGHTHPFMELVAHDRTKL